MKNLKKVLPIFLVLILIFVGGCTNNSDDIENGIVGGLITEIEDPNTEEVGIIGETFIKVKKSYSYSFKGRSAATWYVDEKYPIKLEYDENDPRNITLTWTSGYSG